MATTELTAQTFDEAISSGGLVLVDFWAEWCGPCRAFAPVFERVSEQHPDAVFGKVDTEAEQELAGRLGIASIPTLLIARDGIVLYAEAGALPEASLQKLIDKALELDMDKVRTELAASRPSGS